MTDGGIESVRSVRRDRVLHAENHLHHALNLILFRRTAADDRFLDVTRAVLVDRDVRLERRADRRGARLPQLQRAIGVAAQENALDRDLGRAVLANDLPERRKDVAQAIAMLAARTNASPLDGRRAIAEGVDDSEARDLRSRVDS